MKKYFVYFLTLALFFVSRGAFAALELELTQGMNAAQPIAVVPFAGQGNDSGDSIAAIVQTDLKNSGRFNTLAMDRMTEFPAQVGAVNFETWKRTGAENLVIGSVKAVGGQYQVNFSLIDVFKGSSNSDPVIINKQYVVSKHELRRLAHHISDIVYQQLTGIKGVFSTRIAYVLVERQSNGRAKYVLNVADVDGYNPRPLLTSNEPIMSPAWAPDGKKLAYVSFENKKASIYSQDVNSGSRQLLTSFPGINGAPAWAPDGRRMAVVLSKSGAPKIYLFDLNTHQLQQLTDGNSIDTEPKFSPDGRSIVFSSDRGGSLQVYKLALGSAKVQRLTFDGRYNASPSFTPDEKSIVVLHGNQNQYNVALQGLGGGGLSILTHSGNNSSPTVAPNGQMILYANNSGNRGELGIVSADGRIRIRVPAPEGNVQEPAWSPFMG